jgi:hypothetical protein
MRPPGRTAEQILWGEVAVFAAVALFLWVRGHSPHRTPDAIEWITAFNPSSYSIAEPYYGVIVSLAAIVGAAGLMQIARALYRAIGR